MTKTIVRQAGAKPGLDGLVRSTEPIEVVVKDLRDILGVRLVAYIAGVQETRAVHQWADEKRSIRSGSERKLRTALQVALLLGERDDNAVIQAWFQGLNPQLADRAPARVLRDGDVDVEGPAILAAARAFATVG